MSHPLLQFFAYAHLPAHLQVVSKPFGELAEHLVATLPGNSESTTALRKLLEAKDCAVRALVMKPIASTASIDPSQIKASSISATHISTQAPRR